MSKTPIADFVDRKAEVVASTDPERIYVENVRSFFGLPHSWAKQLCELAVREGIFERRIALGCPNQECHRVISSHPVGETLPEMVHCWVCEAEERPSQFSLNEVEKATYYKLAPQYAAN